MVAGELILPLPDAWEIHGKVIPSGYSFDGMFGDARGTQAAEPRTDCRCRQQLSLAGAAVIPFVTG